MTADVNITYGTQLRSAAQPAAQFNQAKYLPRIRRFTDAEHST